MTEAAQSRSHLTGDPTDATDAALLHALCGLASRVARVPADPNGQQANDLHHMREDLDQVRAEALRRMGGSAPAVTAACLGGADELCPGKSNTGKRCTCSCHVADTAQDPSQGAH